VKCAAKHIENELYVAKEKIQNHYQSIEHMSTEQVLADPLIKGLCNTRKFHHNKILLATWFSFIF
jgi:hypothetical protein